MVERYPSNLSEPKGITFPIQLLLVSFFYLFQHEYKLFWI